jgi:hypothetical protein
MHQVNQINIDYISNADLFTYRTKAIKKNPVTLNNILEFDTFVLNKIKIDLIRVCEGISCEKSKIIVQLSNSRYVLTKY